MKKLISILFILNCIFLANTNNVICNNQQIDTLNQDNNKFRLEIGAGAAISTTSLQYTNYDKLNMNTSSTSSNETFIAFNSEVLNEYKLFIEAYFYQNIALGLETGSLVYFQSTNNDLSNGLSEKRTNEYLSGFYLSPYIVISKFKFGGTLMLPIKNSWSLGDVTHLWPLKDYTELNNLEKQKIDVILQNYYNIYIGYRNFLTNEYGTPIDYYIKCGLDVQSPLNYNKNTNTNLSNFNNYRVFISVGISSQLDIIGKF